LTFTFSKFALPFVAETIEEREREREREGEREKRY